MDTAGMQQWQSGVWVESCEDVKYPHYCGNFYRTKLSLDKEPSEFFEKRVKKQIDKT
jgi:hypothetical protein